MNPFASTVAAAPRRLRTWITAGLPILGLILVAAAPSGASALTGDATLTVSPDTYVGGQQVFFDGNIGQTGERRITLQSNMNRAGDGWKDIDGFSALTEADGSFHFGYPAPGMFNISYRVVSAGLATPGWTFYAKSQDLTLDIVSGNPALGDGQVLAGVPFAINVDTTPTLARRPDLPPPAFPGRTLTLQQRVAGGGWQTLGTTVTDPQGMGKFVAEAGTPGDVVYRVRQEDWKRDGSNIGWFPSFPTYVQVLDPSAPYPAAPRPEPKPTATGSVPGGQNTGATTASQTYRWAPSQFDFAWESGQSLTSAPYRGLNPRGWWLDTSDGSGRAAQHNGGLMLDSQRDNVDGPGDFGTTAVTLRGNPMKYGRWEGRLRLKSTETVARDYHAKLELVPGRPRDYHCGAQNITVADVTAHGTSVTFGAKALNGKQWSRTLRDVPINGWAIAFAVEVSTRHISWFKEGELVGTVRSRAAVSDVPMTLRLSLVGEGRNEMNRTQVISDWMRGFSLARSPLTTNGPALSRGTHNGGC
jgi:hypothetical protein